MTDDAFRESRFLLCFGKCVFFFLSLGECDVHSLMSFVYMRRFTSTVQAWHKIVLFSAHVQINLEKLITSS